MKRHKFTNLEVLEESALASAQCTIQIAMDMAKINKAQLAYRMGCARSFVTRMMGGGHNLTVRTLARALACCENEVRFSLERQPSTEEKGKP